MIQVRAATSLISSLAKYSMISNGQEGLFLLPMVFDIDYFNNYCSLKVSPKLG